MDERLKKQSRRLSWLLRHGANEAGVCMDTAGWVGVSEVLCAIGITREQLDEVVRHNDKRRLQLDGDRIRACQGHSTENMPVTPQALEASWSEHFGDAPLWHGTNERALPAIAESGLRSVHRTHVHLAAELDSVVGKRAAVDVTLKVDPSVVRERGHRIYEAQNGVLLVRRVPREALVDLTPMTKRSRKREHELRALFGWSANS